MVDTVYGQAMPRRNFMVIVSAFSYKRKLISFVTDSKCVKNRLILRSKWVVFKCCLFNGDSRVENLCTTGWRGLSAEEC